MEYVESKKLACQIRKGGGGKNTSSIWRLGVEVRRLEDGAKSWQCLLCKNENKVSIYNVAATTGSFRHLKVEHGIVEMDKRFVRLEKQGGLISELLGIRQSSVALVSEVVSTYSARHLRMSFVYSSSSGSFRACAKSNNNQVKQVHKILSKFSDFSAK